jgi:peptidoglycan/LPS O-acetylase OafA/YrhL
MAGSLIALGVFRADKRAIRVSTALLMAGSAVVFWVAWSDQGASMFKTDGLPVHVWLIALLPSVAAITFGSALFLGLQDTRLARMLSHPAFAPLALYSYGAYIIHFPLSPWFERTFGPTVLGQWLSPDLSIYCYFVLAVFASFCLAAVSYHAFEIRFLKRGASS